MREEQIKKLQGYLRRQQSAFRVATKTQQQLEFISEIFVQKPKSLKYVKYCVMKAAQINNSFLNVSLPANMVAERVDDLAGRTQCHLEDKWRKACAHFTAFEESTDAEDTAQPAFFIWALMRSFN